MNKTTIYVSYLMLIVLFGCVISCDRLNKMASGVEGTIIYEVSYPYETPSVMMELYPKEMTVAFDNHKVHASLKSSYDMLTTDFIVNHSKKEFIQLLKNMSSRSAMRMNEQETVVWFDEMMRYNLEYSNETKQICGYTCRKTIAHPSDTTKPSIEIYSTSELGIDDSNWWNPYRGIDGFMMAYEIEQYGITMRMEAKHVTFETIEPTEFDVPENYTMVDSNLMRELLSDVVKTYIKD